MLIQFLLDLGWWPTFPRWQRWRARRRRQEPWNPSYLPGLRGWYNADVGFETDEKGNIYWPDQSGNGNDARVLSETITTQGLADAMAEIAAAPPPKGEIE